MTKYMIAVLAVSISLFAVACGGGQEAAKTEGAPPAGDSATPAASAVPAADSATPATPPAEPAKP
jgi:hypothetical protein